MGWKEKAPLTGELNICLKEMGSFVNLFEFN